jgi:hypothetical protein
MPQGSEAVRSSRSLDEKDCREAYWRRVLSDASGSGLTPTAYCRRHGIPPPNFFYWKGEIARRDRRASSIPTREGIRHGSTPVALIPVRVTAPETERGTQGPIEIVLRGGRVVRVESGFDEDTLRRVIAILEAKC